MVDKSFVRVFYRVPVKDILQYMEEQVEKTSIANPMTFPFRRMRFDNYQLTANQTQVDINDAFRSHSPCPFWLVLLEDDRYQGDFGKNPFNFTSQNGIQVECTANGVPIPKASLSLKEGFEQAPHPIQQWTSNICGDYILYYLYHRCHGTPCLRLCNIFHPATY